MGISQSYQRIERGATARFKAVFKSSGTTTDTTTTPTIVIKDPDDAIQLASTNMTKTATGTYTYLYAVSGTASLGVWSATISATSGGNVFTERVLFSVVIDRERGT